MICPAAGIATGRECASKAGLRSAVTVAVWNGNMKNRFDFGRSTNFELEICKPDHSSKMYNSGKVLPAFALGEEGKEPP